MRTKGWTLGIIVLASLAFVAVALALVATPADATITGTPLPQLGDDWIIDEDTTVLGEQNVKLQGNITVQPGWTLKVRNSDIKINSSFEGEHGINVTTSTSDGVLDLDDCTIRADYGPHGWFFEVRGGLIIDTARLYNVENGLQIYNDNVDVTGMTLYAQGDYGVYIYQADPKIHSSAIYAMGYEGSWVRGIMVEGNSSVRSAPDFDDLDVKVYRIDDISSDLETTNIYFNMRGVEIYYGQFTNLGSIEVTFEAIANVDVDYAINPIVDVYFYVTGYYIHGGTILGGMDLTLTNSTYYVNADSGVASAGTLRLRNYFTALENRISSDGQSPDIFTGFEARNQMLDWNGNRIFTPENYWGSSGFEWYPSSAATSSDTIIVDGIVLEGIPTQQLVFIDKSKNHIFRNNKFNNNYMDYRLLDYWGFQYDNTWINNEIINNTIERFELFWLSNAAGVVTFENNNISYNVYPQLFWWNSNFEDIIIKDNVFIGNKHNARTRAMFHFERTYADTIITGNTFSGNSFKYFIDTIYPYAHFEVTKNTFIDNTGTDWGMRLRYTASAASFDFVDNYMLNNSLNGWFWSEYQESMWTIEGNTLEGNTFGARGFLWLWGEIRDGGYYISSNTFLYNTGAGSYFSFYALGYHGDVEVTFTKNTFINNTATTASNGGLLYTYKNQADITVRDCVFINNSANCIVVYWTYQYYTSSYKNILNFENNEFYNNTGKGIVYSESSDDSVTIRGNVGYGNEDYCVWIDHTRGYQYLYNEPDRFYLYSYAVPRGPLELIIEANNFSYNPGGGIWARVSQYNAQYSSYNPGQPNADIRIKKNLLYSNGPDGWSLGIDNLYRRPTVKANRLDGSSMGQFWGIVVGDPARTDVFDVQIRDVVMDGGAEGRTAYGFHNVEAEFYDCTFTNFSKCFFADGCDVNVYWSGVPEASGETQNDGRIFIWNHLEIWVTWANAEAVDSGLPVPMAIVAMQGANGKYSGAMRTNEEGKLLDRDNDPLVVNPWICDDGVMDAWSPFTITLLAQENVSTAHKVNVVQDFIDPNPLRLTLNDIFKPEVIIANPQDDTLVNESDVLAEGFLFEIGSGIKLFEGRSDMMPEDEWVPITRNVLWQHIFPQMTEGYHNLTVRAADISDNWNISIIEIIVDLQRPDLFVELEYNNATKIPWDDEKGGFFVRDKEIAINGTYGDNYAHLGEVIIRINGVTKFIFPSQWGTIWHPMELKQGINTIIIDATDTAGNRAVQRLYISLDSHPPTMYIYHPLDGQMTSNETMFVTGLTEPTTRLDIVVQSSMGTNNYRTMSQSDGTISYPVKLFENIQKVLVKATDSAGNPTTFDINVILDTTPPDFIINRPSDGYDVTEETRYLITGTMTYEPDARVFIGGQEVINTGVFQREVVLQEGENIIDIVAIDKVDNRNTKYVTIIRDTVPPILEVIEPEGDFLITNNPTISFRGNVWGATGVVIVHKSIHLPAELLDGTWELGEWKYDLELGPQDLEQDIEVIAFDLAENEDIRSIHVRLDIVPPPLQMDDVPEDVDTPFVWINGTTDEGIPFVTVQGVPYAVVDGVFEIQWSLAADLNNLVVAVQDEAGNIANKDVPVIYNAPEPPKPPVESDDELDWLAIVGIGILLVAIVILVTAVFVVSSRRRR